MRLVLVLMLLTVCVCGCSHDQDATGPSSLSSVIRGHVLDFGTGTGVAGTTLIFSSLATGGDKVSVTTDAAGSYSLAQAPSAYCQIFVGDAFLGAMRMTSRGRGDLYVDRGSCVSRYGVITDTDTAAPIAGATVALSGATTMTAADGWYRLDLGCPDSGLVGIGTTFVDARHPNYMDGQAVAGRGVAGVRRQDLDLKHR